MDFTKRVQAPVGKWNFSKGDADPKRQSEGIFKAPLPKNAKPQQDLCEQHKQLKIAQDPLTNQLMCNMCLFENSKVKHEDSQMSALFTAVITKSLKRKFDSAYNQYKDNLCDVAEIDPEHVKDILRQKTKEFFDVLRSQVQSSKDRVNQRVSSSQALKQLDQLLENHYSVQGGAYSRNFDDLKETFDEKISQGKYAFITKNREFYEKSIDDLHQSTSQMSEVRKQVLDLLDQVIQIPDERLELIPEQITSVVEEALVIDPLTQGQECMEVDLPANEQVYCQTEYSQMNQISNTQSKFSNMRESVTDQQPAFTLKQMKVRRYKKHHYISKPYGSVCLYFTRIIAIPGKNELYLIGGAYDLECNRTSPNVQLQKERGYQCIFRNPMNVARAKSSLCCAQMKGEISNQNQKTYIFAVGGLESSEITSRAVERYNTLADVWQTLPPLAIARYNASSCVLNDHLYVFGGLQTTSDANILPLATIERLNLRARMQDPPATFEMLDLQLPVRSCDIGVFPLNQTEVLLLGGFSETLSLSQKLKFSVCQNQNSSTQQEHYLETLSDKGLDQADFFQSMMYRIVAGKMIVYGTFFIHEIDLSEGYPTTSHSMD